MVSTKKIVGGAAVVPDTQSDSNPAPGTRRILVTPDAMRGAAIRSGQASRPASTVISTGAGFALARLHALATAEEVTPPTIAHGDFALWAKSLTPQEGYATADGALAVVTMRTPDTHREVRFLIGEGRAIPLNDMIGGGDRIVFGSNGAGARAISFAGDKQAILLEDGSTARLRRISDKAMTKLVDATTFDAPPAKIYAEYVLRLDDGRQVVIAQDSAIPYTAGERHIAYVGKPGDMKRVPVTMEGRGHDYNITLPGLAITMRTRPEGGPLAFVDGKAVETTLSVLDTSDHASTLGISDLPPRRAPRPKPTESASQTAKAAEYLAEIIRESKISRAFTDESGDLTIVRLERTSPDGVHLPGSGDLVAIDRRTNEARLLENHRGTDGVHASVGALRKLWKDTADAPPSVVRSSTGGRGSSKAMLVDDNPWKAEGFVTDKGDRAILLRRGLPHTHMRALDTDKAKIMLDMAKVVAPPARLQPRIGVQLADGRDLVVTYDYTSRFSGRPWARAFVSGSDGVHEVSVEPRERGRNEPQVYDTELGALAMSWNNAGQVDKITFDGEGRTYDASQRGKESSRVYRLGLPTDGYYT